MQAKSYWLLKTMKIPSTPPKRQRAGKIQISNKSQWPKFKTDRMTARHPISDRNALVSRLRHSHRCTRAAMATVRSLLAATAELEFCD